MDKIPNVNKKEIALRRIHQMVKFTDLYQIGQLFIVSENEYVEELIDCAIDMSNVNILRFMSAGGYIFQQKHANMATHANNMDVLGFLCAKHIYPHQIYMDISAGLGYYNIMGILLSYNQRFTKYAVTVARLFGKVDVEKFLYENWNKMSDDELPILLNLYTNLNSSELSNGQDAAKIYHFMHVSNLMINVQKLKIDYPQFNFIEDSLSKKYNSDISDVEIVDPYSFEIMDN